MTAGVHGTNPLGGNSISETIKFGRIAGHEATQSQGRTGAARSIACISKRHLRACLCTKAMESQPPHSGLNTSFFAEGSSEA